VSERSRALERVLLLIERAVHSDTPEEEARTSAVLAARLIHEHDLLRGASASVITPANGTNASAAVGFPWDKPRYPAAPPDDSDLVDVSIATREQRGRRR
jgi:hypothetical protein